MSLRRNLLAWTVLSLIVAPLSGLAAQAAGTYGAKLDNRPGLAGNVRRGLLQQALRVSEVNLPSAIVEQALGMFERQQDVSVLVYDRKSGQLMPASQSGEARFSVGAPAAAPKRCGSACARFRNPRRLTLENAQATVTAPGLGTVSVTILANSNAAGSVDPQSGQAYVEWPVLIRAPRSDQFANGFTARTTFRGFGQLKGRQFLVVDVATVNAPGGRTFDVIASHSVAVATAGSN